MFTYWTVHFYVRIVKRDDTSLDVFLYDLLNVKEKNIDYPIGESVGGECLPLVQFTICSSTDLRDTLSG